MQLDLTRLSAGTERVLREYPAEAFAAAAEDYRVAGPVRLQFDISRSENRYRLVGQLSATLELACSRCAEAFPWPVAAEFDVQYLPQSANTGEGEFEVAEEDLGVAFYEGEAIDLGQLMREQFYLALPMKPLCAADCRGLCPQCGANRNQRDCGCEASWEDPRLAPLRRLLERRTTNEQ
jgi:uncharacterized protein